MKVKDIIDLIESGEKIESINALYNGSIKSFKPLKKYFTFKDIIALNLQYLESQGSLSIKGYIALLDTKGLF